MKFFVAIAAFIQLSSCSSHVSVRLPYQNPAGVTYVNGFQGQEYPVSYGTLGNGAYVQQPQALQYQSSGLQYQAPLQYQSPAPLRYQSPALQYQTGLRYETPTALVYPAKIEAHHVGYAAAQVPAVTAVPFVKHIPTISNVPVTRYEAHHGVIEKQVDVAKPAISTRKFEVRRPAIQKQFYDIEERVIIRPAGSALVELDEPTSKLQRGPALLSESTPERISATQSPFSHHLVAHATALSQSPSSPNAIPVVAHAPVHVTVAPVISNSPVSHFHKPPSTTSHSESGKSDEESVVVENADFRGAQFSDSQRYINNERITASQSRNDQIRDNLFRSSEMMNENQVASRSQEKQYQDFLRNQREQTQSQQSQQRYNQDQQNGRFPSPYVIARSNGAPLETIARFVSQESATSSVYPSTRTSPEESRNNQQRLIELLTARGGVAEVGFGRDGSASSLGDAGNVRARVISATPAPDYAEPTGERVSTRRVVVSKPVETLQEIDVLEPATKYERISVQQPTFFKTAHLDHVQVHGSVPVFGKALAPAVAHAAVPVYQKTITPATYQQYGR